MNEEKIEKAWEEIDKGNITDGIKILNDVLHQSPNNWKSYYNLGQVYKLYGDNDKSIELLIKAKALDNEGFLCNYLGLAETYLVKNDFENAIVNLREVFISKHPLNERVIEIVNGMGITFYQNCEFEKAKEAIEQADKMLWNVVFIKIKQSSEYPNKYIIHTINNESTIDLEKAFNDFFKMEYLCCQIKNNLGASLAKLGLLEEAKVAFNESIEFTPDGVDYQAPIIALKEIVDLQKEEKEIFKRLGYKEDEILESGIKTIMNKRKNE